MNKSSVAQIETIAKANGMSTLLDSGVQKLKQGVTSFAELQRVLYF
jgi:type IV pilus assembly protein PilB